MTTRSPADKTPNAPSPAHRPLFRSMKADSKDRPVCEDSARGLGVRIPRDIPVDESGNVHPGKGGLSVTPDDPTRMNPLRRPRSLGGIVKDPLFVIRETELGADLAFRPDAEDPISHGFIEPAEAMLSTRYRLSIAGTRPDWRLT